MKHVARRHPVVAHLFVASLVTVCVFAVLKSREVPQRGVFLNIDAEGNVTLGWRNVPQRGYRLTGERREREAATRALRSGLTDFAGPPDLTGWSEEGPVHEPVFIQMHPRLSWHVVHRVLQCLAHPRVQLWDLRLRVDAEGPWTTLELPRDRWHTGLGSPLDFVTSLVLSTDGEQLVLEVSNHPDWEFDEEDDLMFSLLLRSPVPEAQLLDEVALAAALATTPGSAPKPGMKRIQVHALLKGPGEQERRWLCVRDVMALYAWARSMADVPVDIG